MAQSAPLLLSLLRPPRRMRPLLRSSPPLIPKFASSLGLAALRFRPRVWSPFVRFGSSCPHCGGADQQSLESSPKPEFMEPGLYLVATPIGNLEDITLRALRVLRSAHLILSEDTRHSGKLLQHYNIHTPLLSYHKYNEYQRETTILRRLYEGQIVALISDAGTPGISDPGMELANKCVSENIRVIPIPGPSAVIAALSASGLSTNEFTFVGFLPKHASSRKEKLVFCASQNVTQIFYVPPHGLRQFLEEASSIFGAERTCVIAREITKVHEEFWRGTLGEANKVYADRQTKGEITILIEGLAKSVIEPSEAEVVDELKQFISTGIVCPELSNWSRKDVCEKERSIQPCFEEVWKEN